MSTSGVHRAILKEVGTDIFTVAHQGYCEHRKPCKQCGIKKKNVFKIQLSTVFVFLIAHGTMSVTQNMYFTDSYENDKNNYCILSTILKRYLAEKQHLVTK